MTIRRNMQAASEISLAEMVISNMIPGVRQTREGLLFMICSEVTSEVSLVLYDHETGEVIKTLPVPAEPQAGELRAVLVSDLKPEMIDYNYEINGELVTDPSAKLIVGRTPFGGWDAAKEHQVRCAILPDKRRKAFRWNGLDQALRIPFEDVIAMHLHVRGFTMDSHSGVRAKGTFKGIIEKIPYLKKLGINQIILMPAYEFEELSIHKDNHKRANHAAGKSSPLNYWGYTKANYFAPKAAYCAGEQPDKEFMELVKALHKSGIELIMEIAFEQGTSVDFALSVLTWWTFVYHVDGFHILASREITDAAAASPCLKGVKLMANYYDPTIIYGEKKEIDYPHLANYHDGFKIDCRRFLKGDENTVGMFAERSRQGETLCASMNYITGHDGFTLMDLVSYDEKHNEANGEQGRDGADCEFSWNCGEEGPTKKKKIKELRMRQMKNAMAMMMLAQGTPVLLAGDERCNSQGGNNNPYCLDNETTWIDWRNTAAAREMTAFVSELAAFRNAHPMMHTKEGLHGQKQNKAGYPDISSHSSNAWVGAFEYQNRHVGLMYCGTGVHDGEYIYVACNMHWDEKEFALPKLPKNLQWTVALKTGALTEEKEDPTCFAAGVRSFKMQGRTVAVLVGAEI